MSKETKDNDEIDSLIGVLKKVHLVKYNDYDYDLILNSVSVRVHTRCNLKRQHNKCKARCTTDLDLLDCKSIRDALSVTYAANAFMHVINTHGWRYAWKACFKVNAPFSKVTDESEEE